jgi:hypothetical protein
MVADYIGCMIQLPLERAGQRAWGEQTTMTSERYAAGDDAFKAGIAHAPNKESTKVSGLVADARAWRPEIFATGGHLPQVIAPAASSLSPGHRHPVADGRGADPGRRDRKVWPNGAADAQAAEPRVRLEPPLT